jgi:diguanylate cyclase (GGDEF)-like protein/PAS domain S-box-containing protein
MDMSWRPAETSGAEPTDLPKPSGAHLVAPSEVLSSALVHARIGTWRFNARTNQWTYDPVVRAMFGVTEERCNTLHPGDRPLVAEALEKALGEGIATEAECRAVHGDGQERWIHLLLHPVRQCGNSDRYLAGIARDITDQKRAEFDLQERERQFRTIVGNLPGVAYRCEIAPPWKMQFISDAVLSLTGYPKESFIDGSMAWEDIVYPDDLQMVRSLAVQVIEPDSKVSFEYRIVHRNGELRWVQAKARAVRDDHGRPMFFEGFIGDVHELKCETESRLLAEERYRLISQVVTDGVWEVDLSTDKLTVNEAFSAAFGYDGTQMSLDTHWWIEQIHPDDQERVVTEMGEFFASDREQYATEHRFRRADGSYADVYVCGFAMRDENGKPERLVGALQDLSARRLADFAVRESEATTNSIVEASTDCVKLLNPHGRILYINRNGARAMEIEDPDAVLGRKWDDFLPEKARKRFRAALKKALQGGVGRFSEACPTQRGKKKWWDVVISPVVGPDGNITKLVAIARDVTERKSAEEKLVRAATRDPLTQLGNRTYFQEMLADLVEATEPGKHVGLLLMDLDDFKQINDSLGHDAGDAMLKSFAERLNRVCRKAAGLARLGGDEFAVLLNDCEGADELERVAEQILGALHKPIIYRSRILDCHATIGAVLYPDHGDTPEDLLKNGDLALYAAKSARRGSVVLYEPHHRAEMEGRLRMIHHARRALRDDLIFPYYQPKIDLKTGSICGFEALLRWRDADSMMQAPGAISAAFDDLELAAGISDKMIDKVIADVRGWLDRGLDFGHVAINAAAAEFRRDHYAEGLLGRLERAGVPPSCLQLEVTETVFLGRGAEYVERALDQLGSAGISIALDDFGTGYASLRHLKQYPVQVIKIDQSFVRGLGTAGEDIAIIEAVLNLGRSLAMEVVAEGIENEGQESHLRALGCRFGQGFLYSEAVPGDVVPALIAQWSGTHVSAAPDHASSPMQREIARLRKRHDDGMRRAG